MTRVNGTGRDEIPLVALKETAVRNATVTCAILFVALMGLGIPSPSAAQTIYDCPVEEFPFDGTNNYYPCDQRQSTASDCPIVGSSELIGVYELSTNPCCDCQAAKALVKGADRQQDPKKAPGAPMRRPADPLPRPHDPGRNLPQPANPNNPKVKVRQVEAWLVDFKIPKDADYRRARVFVFTIESDKVSKRVGTVGWQVTRQGSSPADFTVEGHQVEHVSGATYELNLGAVTFPVVISQ